MELHGYRDLKVWQRARALAIDVFRSTVLDQFRSAFVMRDQIQRAAISVPSNIAEGWARGRSADSARFFLIARGSLAELSTQAEIAAAVGLFGKNQAQKWQGECQEIAAMLSALIAIRRKDRVP